ncbi:DHH family phosphoesterase [Candidatus Gottesmanbacteria bacterium]|nr:DHH family phosphoesterase [Candidatus Gottesmanbacteria bacterium]
MILPNINEIQTLLTNAQEVLILTHENPSQDSLGASLALFLSLSASKKRGMVACPTPLTVEFGNLVGIDKINQNLSSKNFIISLDYVEGAIEKVSYNITNDKFNLVIEPRAGAPPFSPEKVHYSSGQASPDLIFVLDSANLEQLGKFYQDEKDLYSKVATVNIDYHPNNSHFGKINLIDPSASSTSEIIVFLLQNLGLPLIEDIATNLLVGITFATNNFSESAGAGAFEAAAICLKAGGKRRGMVSKKEEPGQEAPADWLQPKIFKSSSSLPPKDETTLL